MNKKSQLNQNQKISQQLCSPLKFVWFEKLSLDKSNPILHKIDTNLMSKSIPNKFFNLKKYKIKQPKTPLRHQSNHIFTNSGIINKHSQQQRRPTSSSIFNNGVKELNQSSMHGFQKYSNPRLKKNLSQRQSINKISLNQNQNQISIRQQNKKQPYEKPKRKSFRAISAHFSTRKAKTQQIQSFSFRKTSQNWNLHNKMQRDRQQIKGWDIQFDSFDINLVELKVSIQK